MPHVAIGEYQEQVPVEEGLRRIIPSRTGASVGPGLEDIGSSLQKLAQSEAANYSLQALSKAQADWTKQLKDRQEQAAPGAPGFTTGVLADYDKYVKQAVQGAPNTMAGKYLQQRLQEFGAHIANQSINFEANARQSHNEDVAKQSADMTSTELQADPSVFPQRLAERQAAIDSMNLEPQVREKLHQYTQQTLSHFAVAGDIQRDPYGTMQKLNDPNATGYYANLTAEQRAGLMDHADRMLHERVADAERVHMLAKQQQQDASDNLLKQGIAMSTQGSLTPQWVLSHEKTLEPSAMKYLLESSAGKETQSDPATYSDLLMRTVRGEDTQRDIYDSFTRGQLSKEDFTRLTDKTVTEFPNAYKRGISYINTAGKVSELEPDPAKTQTLANMQNDFQDWFKRNGNATDKQVQEEAQDIVKRYQLVRADQNLLTLPVPQYGLGKGTRAAPDMQGAKHDLVQALVSGKLNKDDFNHEAALLQKWQAATDAAAQRKQAAAAKKQ